VSDDSLCREALAAFQRVLVVDLRPALQPAMTELSVSRAFPSLLDEMLNREPTAKTTLMHWIHLPQGFNVMREWMSDARAVENLDFIADVIKFKNLEDVSLTKEHANRICSKFIADDAVAQICLRRDTVNQIVEGLQMRYPSQSLFDDAAEHVKSFIQQDLWATFQTSKPYEAAQARVHSALNLGNSHAPLLLSVRWVASPVRHVIHLSKRIISIGGASCDVVATEAGIKHTSVLRVEPAPNGAFYVSMLWNASPRGRAVISTGKALSDSKSSVASSGIFERNRTAVIAQQTPRLVQPGETFLLGDFEAMVLPFN
jgi:hypothetical protein